MDVGNIFCVCLFVSRCLCTCTWQGSAGKPALNNLPVFYNGRRRVVKLVNVLDDVWTSSCETKSETVRARIILLMIFFYKESELAKERNCFLSNITCKNICTLFCVNMTVIMNCGNLQTLCQKLTDTGHVKENINLKFSFLYVQFV